MSASTDQLADTDVSKDICSICQEFRSSRVETHAKHLQISAAHGCTFCHLIVRILDSRGLLPSANEASSLQLTISRRDREPVRVAVLKPLEPDIEIYRPEKATFSAPDFIFETYPDVQKNSGVPECLSIVDRWFTKCRKEHQICKERHSGTSPTRLLDLTPNGPHHDRKIQLVLPRTAQVEYACLSHCWGKTQPMKTTVDNLLTRLRGIEYDLLPPTFKDAVMLCKRLGLRYLWIDSLCILQDDLADWQHEAGNMGAVYQNAELVISATAAGGSEDGIFTNRTPWYRDEFEFAWKGEKALVRIRPYVHGDDDFTIRLDNPLLTRAWAFQERMLGRRVVSFQAGELYWECDEGRRCECGDHENLKWAFHYYNLRHFLRDLPYGDDSDWNSEIFHTSWTGWIVSNFSPRRLTVDTDKLLAISGIAEIVRQTIKDDYFAGLWRRTLRYGLLWNVNGSPTQTYLPREYRAPSWSWASIDGPVVNNHPSPMQQELAVIEDAQCSVIGQEPTGQVKDGWLTVRGVFTQAFVRAVHADYNQRFANNALETGQIASNCNDTVLPFSPFSDDELNVTRMGDFSNQMFFYHSMTLSIFKNVDRSSIKPLFRVIGGLEHTSLGRATNADPWPSFTPDTDLDMVSVPSSGSLRSASIIRKSPGWMSRKNTGEPLAGSIFCLRMSESLPQYPTAGHPQDAKRNMIALVLGMSSKKPGAYERIGLARFTEAQAEYVFDGATEQRITII